MSEPEGPFWHADTCPDEPTGKLTEQCNCETAERVEQMMEAGRVTEVVVPEGSDDLGRVRQIIMAQIPQARVGFVYSFIAVRQPGGPDVVALAGETLRIAAGRVQRVREDERYDT